MVLSDRRGYAAFASCCCLTIAVGLAACGSDKNGQSVVRAGASSAEALAGLEVSSAFTAALVPLAGADVAVVDGAAPDGGERRLMATWAVDGKRQEAASEGLPPIVFPKAWWDEPTLYVFGRECPQVDLDLVDDIDLLPLEEVCGKGSRFVLRSLDTGTSKWSVVTDAVPTGPDGKAFLIAATGEQALLQLDGGALRLLSGRSGADSAVSDVSLQGATLDSACPLAGGGFFVVSTAAAPPSPLKAEQTVVPNVWLIRGGEASTLQVPTAGAPPESFFPMTCLPGNGVVGLPEGGAAPVLIIEEAGGVTWSQVSLPASAVDAVGGVQLEPAGESLIAWVPRGEAIVPWRQQRDGEWVQVADAFPSFDPPREAVLVGDKLLALVPRFEKSLTTVTVTLL